MQKAEALSWVVAMLLFVGGMLWLMIVYPHQLARQHIRELGHDGKGETGFRPWFAWRPVYVDHHLRWLQPVERNIRYFFAIDYVWCRVVDYRMPNALQKPRRPERTKCNQILTP